MQIGIQPLHNSIFGATENSMMRLPRPVVSTPSSAPGNQSSIVEISADAYQAALVDTQKMATAEPSASIPSDLSLRDLVSKYDLKNITPRQLSTLATELFARQEISRNVTASLVGVELDTVTPISLDQPINIFEHEKMMISSAQEGLKEGDQNMNFSISYYSATYKTLLDISSFTESNRQHISSVFATQA